MIEDILYYIGQFLGIVAVVLGFVSFQMKTPKRILACQSTCALVFALHYLLIGAPGAAALNLLAAFNDILYFSAQNAAAAAFLSLYSTSL